MCGIVGALGTAPIDPQVVEQMRDRLAHRGPDRAGLFSSAEGELCLGHRRLSIIDLDVRSSQPLHSWDKRFVISFNGEIYNYQALRKELAERGARFVTESDTEAIMEAIRYFGNEAVERLSGMFAYAVWDRETRRLYCARDRAGEKPFYYAEVNGTFIFASEPKALLAYPGLDKTLDPAALIDVLTLGYVADPKSIYASIRRLPPAHTLLVEAPLGAAVRVNGPRRYWSLRFGAHQDVPTDEELRQTLIGAANEMAIADVPLGAFLSGGVDSSSVVAALSKSGHQVRSFTIGFEEASYDERPYARQVAELYRTEHTERVVTQADVMAFVEDFTWYYDEPFCDYSCYPTYHLCREARRSITVALSGDGADEVFAGYSKYQRLARRAELAKTLPVPVARVASKVAARVLPEGDHWRRTLRQYGLSAADMLSDMLCVGFTVPLLREVARGPLSKELAHYQPQQLVAQHLKEAEPERVGLLNSMRHLDLMLTLPGDMLVKVDRASMAVALEARPLFLHKDVMELAARVPSEGLANNSAAKLRLKRAVRPWFPEGFVDRKKQGFALPLPKWLGGDDQVASLFGAAQRSKALSEFFDMKRIAELCAANRAGRETLTGVAYAVFVLDQWLQKWSVA